MSQPSATSVHAHGPTEVPEGVTLRHDWTLAEVKALYELPLLELVHRAQTVHRLVWGDNKVQLCSLLSIKTGGCSEDCAYCPQAARYKT
ncbi:MAG: biotin synthase, partial [Myxococcaceae bacterium]|nr:biotin synthase [Myxococcaceae bacterium]